MSTGDIHEGFQNCSVTLFDSLGFGMMRMAVYNVFPVGVNVRFMEMEKPSGEDVKIKEQDSRTYHPSDKNQGHFKGVHYKKPVELTPEEEEVVEQIEAVHNNGVSDEERAVEYTMIAVEEVTFIHHGIKILCNRSPLEFHPIPLGPPGR